MMLSLLEVLHQLPAPREVGGGNHKSYGRPAGPQQCCSAVRPACERGFFTLLCYQQPLPFALMNGSYCYTLCHTGLQHRDT